MIHTQFIILAQGSQSRMGDFIYPKQLLPLAAHTAAGVANVTIIERTIAMIVKRIVGDATSFETARRICDPHALVVVGDARFERIDAAIPVPGATDYFTVAPATFTLDDPGNSSLKGLHRVLQYARDPARRTRQPQRTVVLFGDVLYSWACLGALLNEDLANPIFVGTSDLGAGGGELWGLAWKAEDDKLMDAAMDLALKSHSVFDDTYQPGQMRHLLWGLDRVLTARVDVMGGHESRPWWFTCDDYTMDVDLPEHLLQLAAASFNAIEDDKLNGLVRRG